MRQPRALLFDLDDTLLDWSAMAGVVVRTTELLSAARPGLDPAALAAANMSVWTAYWPEVESDWMWANAKAESSSEKPGDGPCLRVASMTWIS